MPFGGRHVDPIGMTKRRTKRPCPVDVLPGRRLDEDLERRSVAQRLRHIYGPERVTGPVRGGPETGHDLECEVPGRDERLGRGLAGEHLASRDSS